MAEPVFDKRDQLEKIKAITLPEEQLFGVFDMKGRGTGYMGVLDKRIVFADKNPGFFGGSESMISIPYSRISTLTLDRSRGTEIGVIVGSMVYEFDFRDSRKAVMVYQTINRYMLGYGPPAS